VFPEAALAAASIYTQINDQPSLSKEEQIKALVYSYAKAVRERLNQGKRGRRARSPRADWREIKAVIRQWPGKPPSLAKFAAEVPSLRAPSQLAEKQRRQHEEKVRENLRARLRSCKEAES